MGQQPNSGELEIFPICSNPSVLNEFSKLAQVSYRVSVLTSQMKRNLTECQLLDLHLQNIIRRLMKGMSDADLSSMSLANALATLEKCSEDGLSKIESLVTLSDREIREALSQLHQLLTSATKTLPFDATFHEESLRSYLDQAARTKAELVNPTVVVSELVYETGDSPAPLPNSFAPLPNSSSTSNFDSETRAAAPPAKKGLLSRRFTADNKASLKGSSDDISPEANRQNSTSTDSITPDVQPKTIMTLNRSANTKNRVRSLTNPPPDAPGSSMPDLIKNALGSFNLGRNLSPETKSEPKELQGDDSLSRKLRQKSETKRKSPKIDESSVLPRSVIKSYVSQSFVNSVTILTDPNHPAILFSGHEDGTVRQWDTQSGELMRQIAAHTAPIWSVEALRGEDYTQHRLYSGAEDYLMKEWDVETGTLTQTYSGHTNTIRAIAAYEDHLFSGGWDNKIRQWDRRTGMEVKCFNGHRNWVTCLSLIHNPLRLFSGSYDGTVREWNVDTGAILRVFGGPTSWIISLLVVPDLVDSGVRVFTGCETGIITEWDTSASKQVTLSTPKRVYKSHADWVWGLCVVNGKLYSGSSDCTIREWDLEQGTLLNIFDKQGGAVLGMAGLEHESSNKNCKLFAGSADGYVREWKLEKKIRRGTRANSQSGISPLERLEGRHERRTSLVPPEPMF
ncbi:WD40-repeat-containing domain protein [Polychytrium aggregatum]|uniref:WD40-repeat-containing domain protein n=1 Tax=Polychytrium aggregatum TaxID=110093 RepID=UPI0022FE3F8A|nr:WD40-repeat-containing domain protein [Polychytrium aggregatum]KAI9204587.1 WD40-repeat-containing domain protein [Polychytrium aggregatum]